MSKTIPYACAGVFALAAVLKALFPAEAVLGLEGLQISRPMAEAIVFVITAFEAQISLNLIAYPISRTAVLSAAILLVFLNLYLGYLITLANPPSCGCLGMIGLFKSSRHAALFGIVRNTLLIFALALHFRHYCTTPFQRIGRHAV